MRISETFDYYYIIHKNLSISRIVWFKVDPMPKVGRLLFMYFVLDIKYRAINFFVFHLVFNQKHDKVY